MAEFLLRVALDRGGPGWRVSSAGVEAEVGRPMHPLAERALTDLGFAPGQWSSTATTRSLLDSADLILTAETDHRSAIVKMAPGTLRRTFTLRQFARMAPLLEPIGDVVSGEFRHILASRIAAVRAHLQPVTDDADDIADPLGHNAKAFRACARTIQSLAEQVAVPFTQTGSDIAI
jgi:protein-tyrosine phosphatase